MFSRKKGFERFELALNNVHVPVLILDTHLIMVWCNDAFARSTDITKDRLLGQNLFDAIPATDKAYQQVVEDSLNRVANTGVTERLPAIRYDLSTELNSAVKQPEVRYWSVITSPIFDENGAVEYLLNQPTDVTEIVELKECLGTHSENPEAIFDRTKGHFQSLYNQRSFLGELVEQAPGFVCILSGSKHRYTLANQAYLELFEQTDIIGKTVVEVLPEVVTQGFISLLDGVYLTGEPYTGKGIPIDIRRASDLVKERRYIDFIYQPIMNSEGHVDGIYVQGHDVTELHRLTEEIEYQATHDPLTDLPNRRSVQQSSLKLASTAGTHVLLYLDLDHFKIINDRCGHQAGDDMLVSVAAAIKQESERGLLARVGGDEFIMILEDHTIEQATVVAGRLIDHIESINFYWQNVRYNISASVGVAAFGRDIQVEFSEAMSMADSACFIAKEKGRGRIYVSANDDSDVSAQREDMDWVTRLRNAMRDERIVLFGQDIVGLSENSNGVARKEVLSRMTDEQGNILSPAHFIKAAERFGVIESLDRHIITKVFAYLRANETAVKLFVNVSGITLSNPAFSNFISKLLRQFPEVTADMICFEVTETAAVNNIGKTAAVMQRLVDLGFEFALDDFGTGAATFSYLDELPIKYLKIDGQFIKGMLEKPVNQVIVESIQNVAQAMRIMTIAESIETPELRALVTKLGIDYAQGYAIHRPSVLD